MNFSSKSSSKNKRKGEIGGESSTTRSIVFSPRTKENSWNLTKKRIQKLQYEITQEDDLFNDITKVLPNFPALFQKTVQVELDSTISVEKKLQQQIEEMQSRMQSQTEEMKSLKNELDDIYMETHSVEQAIKTSDNQIESLSEHVQNMQTRLTSLQSNCTDTQQKFLRKMPRLQQQLSLYGRISGIKWNFEQLERQRNVLVGHVNLPSRNTLRRFEIDCREQSRYDIAQRLWALMDGNEYST